MVKKTSQAILVTAIGTAAATTIVQELKKCDMDFWIIGTDINNENEIVTSKDVDQFYKFPSAVENQEYYVNYVLEFCQEHDVRYLFSTIDEEVVIFSKNRECFMDLNVKLCIPNHELIMACHYKNSFNDWIKKNYPEIAIEDYLDISSITDQEYPLFVKPVEGRASIGCKKINSKDELIEVIEKYEPGAQIVLQQYINCKEIITADVIRNNKTNQIKIVQRKELLRNEHGAGIAVEIIYDPKLEQICKELSEKLQLNGVINIEFFRTDDGYKIIEINPRFSSGAAYTCMSGCNLVMNALRIVDGIACEYEDIVVGRHFARRYETYEL